MILQKSKEFNIDLNAKTTNGMTALHYAVRNGDTKLVEMIIQKSTECNIDLNAKNKYNQTAFGLACNHGYSKIVNMLNKNQQTLN